MCQVSGLFPYEQQTTNNIYVVSNNCLAVLGKNCLQAFDSQSDGRGLKLCRAPSTIVQNNLLLEENTITGMPSSVELNVSTVHYVGTAVLRCIAHSS